MIDEIDETHHGQMAPQIRRLGRGAISNAVGRYEPYQRQYEHDGWDIEEDPTVLRTIVKDEYAKSVISYNTSPDLAFDRSINTYRGCEHGCIYCFARPTHAYLGYSPGIDFETQLITRPNAAECLELQLRKPRYIPRTLAIGTNTDPYQPIEKKREIMRSCLKVLAKYNHPVAITTKGCLVERDIDILAPMAAKNLVSVGVSITTLSAKTSRLMEPRVPSPARRLNTIRALHDAGIPVRVMVGPVVPSITDHELEDILATTFDAGARAASWIMLRLPQEVSPLFQEWLHMHYPDRAARVMKLVRAMHDGKDYSSDWGKRMRGTGPYADMIAQRFRAATRRIGFSTDMPSLRCDVFKAPPQVGDQLSLF